MRLRLSAGAEAALLALTTLGIRALPAALDPLIGRDLTEYQSIAASLREGRGFELPIKVYYAVETPVVHYAGYDRAPLLPVLLAAAGLISPSGGGPRWLGPLLMVAVVLLIHDVLRRSGFSRAAFWVALWIALHPGLHKTSLLPLTEILSLALITLTIWFALGARAPAWAGAVAGLAFLARPASAAASLVLGLGWLLGPDRRAADFLKYLLLASLGPIALLTLNVLNEAPPLTTPQGFLFGVLSFNDRQHYLHQGPVYPSTLALLGEAWPQVIHRIGRNAFHFLIVLGEAYRGVVLLIAIAPWAVPALLAAERRRVPLLIFVMGCVDLSVYMLTWSTFDADRFLTLCLLGWIVLIGSGLATVIEGSPPPDEAGRRFRLAALGAFVAAAMLWGTADAYRSYLAVRERARGAGYANPLRSLWRHEEIQALKPHLESLGRAGALRRDTPIASNEPWLAWNLTGAATFLLPYDLKPDEWSAFLDRYGARFALIHGGDWPSAYGAHRESLERALETAQWTRRGGPTVHWWERPASEVNPPGP